MTPDEQLELFARYDDAQLFTAAVQLMRRIHDEVVWCGESPVHGDLPRAIDDLSLGPWHEIDQTLVAEWPYQIECTLLRWLMAKLEAVTSDPGGLESVVTTRWLLIPSAAPLWASG